MKGISLAVTPAPARASHTALAIAVVEAMQPASPIPLIPSGLDGEEVTARWLCIAGTSSPEVPGSRGRNS